MGEDGTEVKYLRKLKTYWFILNHVLDITDDLSLRLDELACDAAIIPKKRKSTKKLKEKK